jgi:exosortase
MLVSALERKNVWGGVAWLGALMVILFFPVLRRMAGDWYLDAGTQHGWFAVAFAAFLVWRMRETLPLIPTRPSVWGWGVMAAALVLLLIGYFGGDFLVMRLSVWFSIIGLIWAMLGGPFLNALAFPLFVLLWTIRVPLLIGTGFVVALQNVAELIAVTVLRQIAGVAVYRDGDSFEISGARLEGVELFSAIRLVVSVCFFAMAYAYLADRRALWRWALPILSIAALVLVASGFGILILWVSDRNVQTGSEFERVLTGRIPALLALGLPIVFHRMVLMRERKKGMAL